MAITVSCPTAKIVPLDLAMRQGGENAAQLDVASRSAAAPHRTEHEADKDMIATYGSMFLVHESTHTVRVK